MKWCILVLLFLVLLSGGIAQAQTPIIVNGECAVKVSLFDVSDIAKYVYKASTTIGGPVTVKEVAPPTDTLFCKDFPAIDQNGLHYLRVEAHDTGGLITLAATIAFELRKDQTLCLYRVEGMEIRELLGCTPFSTTGPPVP